MDSTISVSKGVFVFKNGATRAKGKFRRTQPCASLLDRSTTGALWYRSYERVRDRIHDALDRLQSGGHEKIIDDLLNFVENCQNTIATPRDTIAKMRQIIAGHSGQPRSLTAREGPAVLPTAALLTGINQMDHLSQFERLAGRIRNNTFSLVVLLHSRDCASVKVGVETIVAGFVEESCTDAGDDEEPGRKLLRRNQLNFEVLNAWYREKHQHLERKPKLTVIMPDFEVFNAEVLQSMIVLLHSYLPELPFVLILGVATSVATIHSVLPYHVTSKIQLSIFQSEPSVTNLNKVLDNVFLTPYCPFHLSGKTFQLLVDIFLFYDFSVKGFIEGFKYALMEHYFQGSIYALCSIASDRDDLEDAVEQLTAEDLESIRQLLSFRPFIESLDNPQEVIDFLTKDDYLRRMLPSMLIDVHNYWFMFHCSLEMLQVLVQDLPRGPLGKQLRELYAHCISSDVTQLPEYRECMQLVAFMSKDELLDKVVKLLQVILKYQDQNDDASIRGEVIFEVAPLEQLNNDLERFAKEIASAGTERLPVVEDKNSSLIVSPKMGREELKEKLLNAARQPKQESTFTKSVNGLVSYLTTEVFRSFLRPTSNGPPLIELFVFGDAPTIRRHIVGVPRAALHTALNNPHYYLQCECCAVSGSDGAELVPTMPDLSVAYKLHAECGRMINLFDWLQAFRTVLEDDGAMDEQERQVDPMTQARFTRAVAELEFLGFIKSSKRKTDHVARMTW